DELPQDVSLRGAHRAAHTDLAPPQGHAHQHHVHDHDSTDDHRDRAHHDEHPKKSRADAAPQSHVAFLGADEEVVLHGRSQVTPRPQNELRLILGLLKDPRTRPNVDGDAGVGSLHAQEYREWNQHKVVLILAEDAADSFHD